MAIARREIVSEGTEGLYHCVSRCVRRAFLCGLDPYTGKSFEHRKAWVRTRIIHLAQAFGIEVCAYAVMSNHLHLILRTRPDWEAAWSDQETARRWLMVFPKKKDSSGGPKSATEADVRLLSGDKTRVGELRKRLGSISWFMRCLNENIARRANREDDCKGRFWEGRFYCQALLDESALLACMAYVDLNPVRAGLAQTPEQSEFTSVSERIAGRIPHPRVKSKTKPWLCPIGDEGEPDRRGLLDLTLEDYLEIIDWTGRSFRPGARGSIPDHLEPILTRLGVDPQGWTNTIAGYGDLFHRAAGRVDSIRAMAAKIGRRWLCGLASGKKAFKPG